MSPSDRGGWRPGVRCFISTPPGWGGEGDQDGCCPISATSSVLGGSVLKRKIKVTTGKSVPGTHPQMNFQPASNTATNHPLGHCLLMNKVRKAPRPKSADHLVCDPTLPLDAKQPLTRSKLYIHFPIISFLSPRLRLQPQDKPRP